MGDGNRHDRPDISSHLYGALSEKRATAALMINTATDVARPPKRMLTLRRKEVSIESLHRHRVPQQYSQNAARRHTRFARPGNARRSEPARKTDLTRLPRHVA